MPHALVRELATTFDRAITGHGRSPRVDVAQTQHRQYVHELERAGYEVTTLTADDDYPDCVFVEDTAVIVGDMAVITRPGAESRRGETGPVLDELGRHFETTQLEAPGTLDGGDVMLMGEMLYVGRSQRTNDEGIAQLTAVAHDIGLEVVIVPVAEVLHLKSGVLPVTADTVVVTPGTVDESLFSGLRVLYEADGERHRFSALRLGDDEVLVTANAPRTAAGVADLGVTTTPIDVSEIQAADGGLTCLSIVF